MLDTHRIRSAGSTRWGKIPTPGLSFFKAGKTDEGSHAKDFQKCDHCLEIRFPGNEVPSTDAAAKRSESEADVSSLPSRDPSPHSPQSSHSQAGQGVPATDRVKVEGLYFHLLRIRFQPTTEISPEDEMDSFDFKL